jgi:hypothetical protein
MNAVDGHGVGATEEASCRVAQREPEREDVGDLSVIGICEICGQAQADLFVLGVGLEFRLRDRVIDPVVDVELSCVGGGGARAGGGGGGGARANGGCPPYRR